MSLLKLLGALVVLVPVLYMYAVSVVASRFPSLTNKRICLLIAHPDDEAMFFAPTVLALTRPETGNHVKILCLSSGDAAGLGATRKRELVKSAMTLGLRHEDDVFVVDSPDFPDSMSTHWDSHKIASLLASAFTLPAPPPAGGATKQKQAASAAPPSSSSSFGNGSDAAYAGDGDRPPAVTIDVLVTFDDQGVSGHPNHVSLFRGARQFVAALVQGKPGWRAPVDLYTLTTVPLVRKYTSVLDLLPTLGAWALRLRRIRGAREKAHPQALVFLADLNPSAAGGGLGTAWRAMTTAHLSQMVWFRYGWIALSRYMVMNDLRLEGGFGQADLQKKP